MPPSNRKRPGLGAIDSAPTHEARDFDAGESEAIDEILARTQEELAATKAELDKERGKASAVRARLMEPYANKVFGYLVGYSIVVTIIMLLDGFSLFGFDLANYVLGIIAGSTAVSAIGLVGFVVSGLFAPARNHR